METPYRQVEDEFKTAPRRWLVTGAAGFIGSHLVEKLLSLRQEVVGLDNLSTGKRENLTDVKRAVGEEKWARFRFIEGDIVDSEACRASCQAVDYVLHQAALGSVPRSVADPLATHRANLDGFLNMLIASRDAGVQRFVYASSSSVYGDSEELPKVEERIGRELSPYAVTKRANELYASVFVSVYGFDAVGLRYFNVFGPRQDANGAYAAVIPKWIGQILSHQPCAIYGDGMTSRDFCYVANAVQANLLAAVADRGKVAGEVFNVAGGSQISLKELYQEILEGVRFVTKKDARSELCYSPFRVGDVRHSRADISKAKAQLCYEPTHDLRSGLKETLNWYWEQIGK